MSKSYRIETYYENAERLTWATKYIKRLGK